MPDRLLGALGRSAPERYESGRGGPPGAAPRPAFEGGKLRRRVSPRERTWQSSGELSRGLPGAEPGPAPGAADDITAPPLPLAAPPPPQIHELLTSLASPVPPAPDKGQLLMFAVPPEAAPSPADTLGSSAALASQLAATDPGRKVTAAAQRQLSRVWYLVAGLPLGAIALSLLLFIMQNPVMLGLVTTWMRGTGVATLLHPTGEDCTCPPDRAP